jgi:hypothetical protein
VLGRPVKCSVTPLHQASRANAFSFVGEPCGHTI